MKFLLRGAVPIVIIALAIFTAKVIIKSKPDVKLRKPPKSVATVEVMRLEKSNFQVWLKSNGTVRPRTQSTLIPEVSGRIMSVSSNFREGSFFEKGNILLEIDPSDYKTAVVVAETEWLKAKYILEEEKIKIKNYGAAISIAEAELARVELNLKEEEARSKLALRNWRKLGKKGKPGVLVLRKPQLMSAQYNLEAAKAKLAQQKRDEALGDSQLISAEAAVVSAAAQLKQKKISLKRTKIVAPYAGRIRKQHVDLGQYVSPGTLLADIYAVDYVEIRLPLTNHQMIFVDLPELYRGESEDKTEKGPVVKFIMRQGTQEYIREGRIVRTEGAVDPRSQQLFVVAQINNPYGRQNKKVPPLKIGQFIEAKIKGALLKDVFVIPSSTLGEGNKVLIVDDSSYLSPRKVHVVWSTNDQVVIDSGLSPGERLSLTPLRYVVNNKAIKVQIKGEQSDINKKSGKSNNKKTRRTN